MNARRGDRGHDIVILQTQMNRLGFPIAIDGIFGDETDDAVRKLQGDNGLLVDGWVYTATTALIDRLLAAKEGKSIHDEPPPDDELDISVRAYQLILDHEVGGGEPYYTARLRYPTVPGKKTSQSSGITIGIGYDLGYEGTMDPWRGHISNDAIRRLEKVLGQKGDMARNSCRRLQGISIPWKAAVAVFDEYTLPNEIKKTAHAFPGFWNLPLDAQGALVSLVFNRGTSMSGDSRREMREIRDAVRRGDIPAIASALKSMKRLWTREESGLWRRRDAEANLVLGAVA